MLSNEDAVIAFARQEKGNSKNIFHEDNQKLYSYGHHFVLAVRLNDGDYLINGDKYSVSTSAHTSLCIRYLKPNVIIPFSALDRVTRDYHLIKVVDRSPDKYIPRTRKDPITGELVEYEEHRLGSAVVRFEDKYYLSSIDSGAKGRGGYFLVELPGAAITVDEAFDMLFPENLDRDTSYIRQGEFFFVPTEMKTNDLSVPETPYTWGWYDYINQHAYDSQFETKEQAMDILRRRTNTWGRIWDLSGMMVHKFEVKDPRNLSRYFPTAGTGHAHIATEIRQKDGDFYVRGTIRHPEHCMAVLGKIWHRVYVNRAVRSFSAGGNVD